MTDGGFVPVVDLTLARSGAAESRRRVAAEIGNACERSGFFVVSGHGVPDELVERMYRTSVEFFGLDAAAKGHTATADGLGWTGDGGAVAASSGIESRPDLCEVFSYNPRQAEPVWPDEPADFAATWIEYYAAMEELAAEVMRLCALALHLPEKWFDDKIDRHATSLCANWYYPLTAVPPTDQYRRGPHTDWGTMTILHQDDVGGLQVRDHSGQWIEVPALLGSYVVNIGDLMAVWTNDRWVSTMHRVVVPATARLGVPRLSVPFFHQPNEDAWVECLATCRVDGEPDRHSPVTSGEWFERKLAATYAG